MKGSLHLPKPLTLLLAHHCFPCVFVNPWSPGAAVIKAELPCAGQQRYSPERALLPSPPRGNNDFMVVLVVRHREVPKSVQYPAGIFLFALLN